MRGSHFLKKKYMVPPAMREAEEYYYRMKKKAAEVNEEEKHQLEIIKAVAQAWHGRSTNSASRQHTNEFDAYRNKHKNKPTRFKLEAMSKASKVNDANWDFGQSLWDSYELVMISKRLESGLVLDKSMSGADEDQCLSSSSSSSSSKRRKESKNSLRKLISRISSSKRFDVNTPPVDDDDDDLDQF